MKIRVVQYFLLLMIFGASLKAFSIEKENLRTVSVSGSCILNVTSDVGSVVITSTSLNKDVQQASREATSESERVKSKIKNLNLKDLKVETVEYSVNEEVDWVSGKRVSKGFRARIGVKYSTSEIQRLGKVIQIATEEGVKEVGGLNTYVSDEKWQQEYSKCLSIASQNAKNKAEELTRSLGAKVLEVQSIQERMRDAQGGIQPFQGFRGANVRAMESSSDAQVEASQQKIKVDVDVVFLIK
jgi:hypothetical protein